MENNYIYIPDKSQEFRCRVPLKDTDQVFVVDGKGEKMGLSLGKGEILPNMLQVIQVRSAHAAEDLSYSTDYVLGEGAQAKVLLCSHTLSMEDFVTRENVNVKLAQGAILEAEKRHGAHNWELGTILQDAGNCYLYEKMGYHQTDRQTVINDKMTIVGYEKD